MCAMIPMLRVSSSLNALPMVPGTAFFSPVRVATASFTTTIHSLPPVMRERLVRFRHAMHVFFLLHCSAALIRRIDQLIRELVHHRLARALPRILQQPANRQRLPAERIHFHRNLVVRPAHAPRLHFQQRLHVLDGFLDYLQRIVVGLLRHLIHGAVKHALRRRLLAFPHHRADELLHNVAGIHRIGRLCSPENESFAWHRSLSLLRKSFHVQPLSGCLTSPPPLWAASPRTSIVPACDSRLPRRPAFRARCDTARPADPSRGRRAPARWSALAGCGRRREYTWSLQSHSSAARAPLCAARSSVSSASACTRECTRLASPDNPPAQSSAERSTANPEIPPARNSVRTPRGRTILLASVRRGLLGFAGLAPHSGRSSVPFRLTLFRDRR